ncbi:UNVERIFIED_ORG: hypothetical protein HNP28_003137 [Comamonas terrigena]
MSHDRNYKFDKTLPPEIERRLNLFSGLLEIADSGFSEIANSIDQYEKSISDKLKNNENIDINSISLVEFIENWAIENNYNLIEISYKNNSIINDVIKELNYFDIKTIDQIKRIIPDEYSKISNGLGFFSTVPGLIRDWLIINNWKQIRSYPNRKWDLIDDPELFNENEFQIYKHYLGDEADVLYDEFLIRDEE